MRKLRISLFVAAFAALAACQPLPQADGKYPYHPQFVTPEQVPPTALPGPLKPTSREYKKELSQLLTNQRAISPQEASLLLEEDTVMPEQIALYVFGNDFTEDNYPATYALLRRSGSDAWRIGDIAREHWKSPRPWLVDKRVKPHATALTSGSYPSGHAATYGVWARILSDLAPSYRSELFRRADDIANRRVTAGMHFHVDVRAGADLADKTYCKMKSSPDFQKAFGAAHAEIKAHPPGHAYLPSTTMKVCR